MMFLQKKNLTLTLASASPIRADILSSVGLSFRIEASKINEDRLKKKIGADGKKLSIALSLEKARKISSEGLVLGADQVLICENRLFNKPQNIEEARQNLCFLRGKAHHLFSGIALVRDKKTIWTHCVKTQLTMREFSDEFLDIYLMTMLQEDLLNIGYYALEGIGVHLFTHIEGDYFTILGLPLFPLLEVFTFARCINIMIRHAGVIGWPVEHSCSPLIHGFWLNHYGIEGCYEKLPICPEGFCDFIYGLRDRGFIGANVTLPHKQSAFNMVCEADPIATRLQAVNTLVFEDKKILGYNTDGEGFILGLESHLENDQWKNEAVLVLGAGGAARAIIAALADLKIPEIRVANRSKDKIDSLSVLLEGTKTVLQPIHWLQRHIAQKGCGLLVNTTSLGMLGHPPLEMILDDLPSSAIIADIVYVPLETPLLAEGRQRGHICVDGLGMLLHQAMGGFEKWFGIRPQVTQELQNHVLKNL